MSEYSTSHKCGVCKTDFNDLIALMDHNLIYHDNVFGDDVSWNCKYCNKMFIYEDDMLNHIKNDHSNNQEIDSVQYKQSSLYVCNTCGEEFTNHFCYGEHMSEEHVTYSELIELDNKTVGGSFPGFYLLGRIGMVKKPALDNKYLKDLDVCQICLEKYNDFPMSHDDNIESIESTKSTKFKTFKCDMNLLCYDKIKISPYILTCCNNFVCSQCLKNYCEINYNIKCMYCGSIHIKNDDYIYYSDNDTKIEKAWKFAIDKVTNVFE